MSHIHLVRQPVFNRAESAVGYELRYRDIAEGDDALVRSCLNGAVDVLRGGLPAWVYPNWHTLDVDDFRFTDSSSLWAVIPREISADMAYVAKAAALAMRGVTLVLDEFERPNSADSPEFAFLAHARVVRFDMRTTHDAQSRTFLAILRKMGKRLAADHVFDGSVFAACRANGFEFFQGHHFARPEPLPAAELPTSTLTALRVMALARDPGADERDIERAISSDPAIAFQLLRIVNSAAIGGRGITSIAHALRLAGRENLVRWLSIAACASRGTVSGANDHLARQAVQRAFLAESIAKHARERQPGTAFLVGLFSLLDAVFRVPMADLLGRVSLSDDARAALLDRDGPFAATVELIEAYELGLWDAATELSAAIGLDAAKLPQLYAAALQSANEAVPGPMRAAA